MWSISSSPTFDVSVLDLPSARILLVQFGRIPLPWESYVSNPLSIHPLSLLFGYKSPAAFAVFRLVSNLSPTVITMTPNATVVNKVVFAILTSLRIIFL